MLHTIHSKFMQNNLKEIMQAREDLLPPELEFQVIRQMNAFNHFGNVVELFVPNALEAVVQMISGDGPGVHGGGRRLPPEYEDSWRTAPPRPGRTSSDDRFSR